MKIRFIILLCIAVVVFSCSKDERYTTTETEEGFVLNNNDGRNRTGSVQDLNCNSIFTPINYINNNNGTIIQVTYSDNPVDYPGGVIDIDCARIQYFQFFCGLFMANIQNSDPYKDTWVRNQSLDPNCHEKSKDIVDTQSNTDPRVCVGPDCD